MNMKYDPVVNELAPYLGEVADTKFRNRVHQRKKVKEDDITLEEYRKILKDDLEFESGERKEGNHFRHGILPS